MLLLHFVRQSLNVYNFVVYVKPPISDMSSVKNQNSNKIYTLLILREDGLIMKLFRTIFVYSLFMFVEKFYL